MSDGVAGRASALLNVRCSSWLELAFETIRSSFVKCTEKRVEVYRELETAGDLSFMWKCLFPVPVPSAS